MSPLRFHCPVCDAEVELDRRHLGAEVECGACMAVWVADPAAAVEPPPAPDPPAGPPGLRPRPSIPRPARRRYDRPPPPAEPEPPASGAAITSLVLGVLAVMSSCFCPCLSIPLAVGAMATGGTALLGRGGHGVATAGLTLGIVGLLLTAGAVAFGIGGGGLFQ